MSRTARLLCAAALSSSLFASQASAAAPSDVQGAGPYPVAKIAVPDSATPGFGSATISYPQASDGRRFGAVAVAPGFTGPESSIAWYGPALASHGFVVITFNTTTRQDFPASRASQLLRALDYASTQSVVADRIDPTRTAVMGHSMGGGGAIEAAKRRHTLKAAIGLTPWDLPASAWGDTTPTLIIGGQNDTTAAVSTFASPLYRTISGSTPKALVTLAGAGHLAPIRSNPAIQGTVVSWLKRFVDGDRSYNALLCDANTAAPAGTLSAYQTNCASWK